MRYSFLFLIDDIAQWQEKQFPDATHVGALNHLKKECKELDKDPDDLEEWADAFFMVLQGGRKAAGSLDRFMAEVSLKLQKNEARTWAPMAEDGTVEHVRE